MPPSKSTNETEWVTPQIIRQIFNEKRIHEKVLTGKYTAKLMRNNHPNPTPPGEPYCTRSQILYYYGQDTKLVAVVHQYMRPDGSLGGSGKPDPKHLYLPDRTISTRTPKKNE